jgi:ATP-dependent Clp protease protease subunit
MKKYYSLETNGREADIYIFGDITSWEYFENDVSSYTLSKELQALDADHINIHINSYGGEVAEGLAIYNMLRNHKAKVRTVCEGFACSIASVIFMAGDDRFMNNASMLFIHNAWTTASGNAEQLRKEADDLDVISQGAVAAYMAAINITEDALREMLSAETWILPDDALEMGFATAIVGAGQSNKAAASAHKALFSLVKNAAKSASADEPKPAEPMPEASPAIETKPPSNTEPDPESPQENKIINFLNALMGGKD